jgi:hypothetical protein
MVNVQVEVVEEVGVEVDVVVVEVEVAVEGWDLRRARGALGCPAATPDRPGRAGGQTPWGGLAGAGSPGHLPPLTSWATTATRSERGQFLCSLHRLNLGTKIS